MRRAVIAVCALLLASCGTAESLLIYDDTAVGPWPEDNIRAFVVADPTNERPYITDEYECRHFASEVWWNAYNQGIEGCIVVVYADHSTHAVVKFKMPDGWLWVEPHLERIGHQCWWPIQKTLCGQKAMDFCVTYLAGSGVPSLDEELVNGVPG